MLTSTAFNVQEKAKNRGSSNRQDVASALGVKLQFKEITHNILTSERTRGENTETLAAVQGYV